VEELAAGVEEEEEEGAGLEVLRARDFFPPVEPVAGLLVFLKNALIWLCQASPRLASSIKFMS
jgi:hypothetical protein